MNDLTSVSPSLQDEVWKPVVGYEGIYEVSNLGRVKRVKKATCTSVGRILIPYIDHLGYARVTLFKYGKKERAKIHRIEMIAFGFLPPTPKHEVNHKNCIRNDNHLENLEWMTRSENEKYAYSHGFAVAKRGEDANNVKLNWEKVAEIRSLATMGYGQREISRMFNVSHSCIAQVITHSSWKIT